ncbi:MAG TPA: FkbM family methyltransferase [Stellaceae bacterium]|jgi:hypothetical protein
MASSWLDRLVGRIGVVRGLRELLVENNRQLQRIELDLVRHDAAHPGFTYIDAEMKRPDHAFGSDFACDLVQIDVEGHELEVLEGMSGIIARLPRIVILSDKLCPRREPRRGWRASSRRRGSSCGRGRGRLPAYRARTGATLRLGRLCRGRASGATDGWARPCPVLALSAAAFGRRLASAARRAASQRELWGGASARALLDPAARVLAASVEGEVEGKALLTIQERRSGHPVSHFALEPGSMTHVFTVGRDLLHFECAVRVLSPRAAIRLRRIDLAREVQRAG